MVNASKLIAGASTATDAKVLDSKVDDGDPKRGHVLAAGASIAGDGCAAGSRIYDSEITPGDYVTSVSEAVCMPFFQLD